MREDIQVGDLLFRAIIIKKPETGIVLETRPTNRTRYGTSETRMEYKVWDHTQQKHEWVDEMHIGIDWITVDRLLTILT